MQNGISIFALAALLTSVPVNQALARKQCVPLASNYIKEESNSSLDLLAECLGAESRIEAGACIDQASLYVDEQSAAMAQALFECISNSVDETLFQPSRAVEELKEKIDTLPNIEANDIYNEGSGIATGSSSQEPVQLNN